MAVQQESVVTPERLDQGITWQQWMDKIERNKDKFQENYEAATLNADDVAAMQRQPASHIATGGTGRSRARPAQMRLKS